MKIYHKYKSQAIQDDGFHFHSKLEHRYYKQLLLRQRGGDVVFFLRQVPFHLTNGVKMVIDFVEFLNNGEVKFVEIKGVETPLYITKKKMLESLYPIKLDVIKKV